MNYFLSKVGVKVVHIGLSNILRNCFVLSALNSSYRENIIEIIMSNLPKVAMTATISFTEIYISFSLFSFSKTWAPILKKFAQVSFMTDFLKL